MYESNDHHDATTATPSHRSDVDVHGAGRHGPGPGAGATSESPSHECHLLESQVGPVRVVRVTGHLDWHSVALFRDLMLSDRGRDQVVVDLSATKSDAAGTGGLLVAAAHAKEIGQHLVFVVVDPLELDVLGSVGLDQVAPIVGSVAAALASLGASAVPVDAVTAARDS